MSNNEAPKKQNTTLKRALWVALVILAIVLTGLWTFEPEIVETETQLAPEGEVTNQVRIPLHTATEQVPTTESGTTGAGIETDNGAVADAPSATNTTKPNTPITPVIKKVTEDTVIQPSFISDLSKLIVTAYKPKGSHPAASKNAKLMLDAKVINVHYGIEMTGLSWKGDDLAIGRRSVMRYALRPTMINALYMLYKQRFVDAIDTELTSTTRTIAGTERTLTAEERNDFYRLAAQRIRATAGVIKSCAKVDSAMSDIGVWLQSERDAIAANLRFQSALHDYQVSKEMNSTPSVTDAAKRKMQAEGTAYEEAIRSREEYKAALASMIRKFKWAKDQDDETNLYIASWVFRRSKDISNPKQVMMTIQDRLLDLAGTMDSQASR
ncbi:hypothetical protein [Halodesulfovibrio sp.]|jgi:hypothetical protein|uniref:hypothetical protein n=1 Tax=Halodesulfovibrio sp. TaxID=1912772 RepID=UPI0025E360BA|nr:hypothetical protein [Halodesulfovibrio sp.]MCT4534387.1 hypothetical protein [Halodesulfovibrio sp.]